MVSKIIYHSLFDKSFRWKSEGMDYYEKFDMIYCAECDSFNKASYLSEGRYKICCPTCQKKIINILHEDYMYTNKVYSKIFNTEDKITFSCAFYHYMFKYNFKKKSFRKMSPLYRYNITYNKKTKNIYIIKKSNNPQNNKIANITLGNIPISWKFIIDHLFYMKNDSTFYEFKKLLMEQSTNYWKKDHSQMLDIDDIGIYIKYPQLTLLPTDFAKDWLIKQELSKSLNARKSLEKLPLREKEILHWLTGKPSTRKDRNLLKKEPNLIYVYKLVTTLFDNVDIRHKVLQMFQQRYDLNGITTEAQIAYMNGYDFFMKGYFKSSYLSELLKAKRILEPDFNFTKLLIESWELNIDIKEDERSCLDGEFFTLTDDIQDCVKMYKSLRKEIANYKVSDLKRNRDLKGFKKLHDNLIHDYAKLKQKLRMISYTSKEKERLEVTIGSYNFNLAKSNHHLAEVGIALDNCVYSYSEEAINKELYIVVITDKYTQKITHCLEIAIHNTSLQLVQAKAYDNQYPTEEDSFIILEYCYNRKIEVNTYDISSETEQKYKDSLNREKLLINI